MPNLQSRVLLLFSVVVFSTSQTLASNSTLPNAFEEFFSRCSANVGKDQCSMSYEAKSRQKRFVQIPNLTSIAFMTRLIVPQPPIGVWILSVKVRFFLRSLFTESLAGPANFISAAFSGRSLDTGEESGKEKRSVAEDQMEIFKKFEKNLNKGQLPGRQCIQRAICELAETPIDQWSVIGELIHNIIIPKQSNLTVMQDYIMAEQIGLKKGNCLKVFPQCPISLFNFLPDVYTKDDEVTVSFDPPEKTPGSNFSKAFEDGLDSSEFDDLFTNRMDQDSIFNEK